MTEPIVRPVVAAEGTAQELTAVAWAANLVETSLKIPLGVGRMVRDEAFRVAYTWIDWVEGTNQSYFKVARESVHQFDLLSRHAADGVESMVGAFAKTIRGSGEAAGEVVSKTAVSLMGAKQA